MIRTMLSTLCLFVLTMSVASAQCTQQSCLDAISDANDNLSDAYGYLSDASDRLADADVHITDCEDLLEDFELFCPTIAQDYRDDVETLRASHDRIDADIDRETDDLDGIDTELNSLSTDANNWANLTAAERTALCAACNQAVVDSAAEGLDAVGVRTEAGDLKLDSYNLWIAMDDAQDDCYN